MMWIGIALLAAAIAMGIWYRPAWGEGAKLCALCAVMGVAGLGRGDGSTLFTVLEALLSAVAAVCCLFRLHHEKLRRLRAEARRAACAGGARCVRPAGKLLAFPGVREDRESRGA